MKKNTIHQKRMRNLFLGLLVFVLFSGCTGEPVENQNVIRGIRYSDGVPVRIEVNDEGFITAVEPLGESEPKPEYYVSPGLIDLQINGYMGIDFTDTTISQEDMREVTRALWATGVTQYLPTVITNSNEVLRECFRNLGKYVQDPLIEASIPGFHLEGPYLSPIKGFRGAHLEKYIRPADIKEFETYRKLSGDRIKMVTLAPEYQENFQLIHQAVAADVVVSLGHHNADAQQVRQAVEAGARMSTHLGNGCANEINRHHNPLWPQLSNDSLTISIIADGFHLTREEVRTFYKVKGDNKTILVSDALDLAGLPPGIYNRGEREIELTQNVVKFPAENVLAGAASPISRCVVQMMDFTGCSLKDAINMASRNPARLMGLPTGELRPGNRADLILFDLTDDAMEIHKTIVSGKQVYKRSE